MALGSFVMSSVHGAGPMLVPALMPLCGARAATGDIGASGPLTLAIAAIGVHTAAMLAVTGLVSIAACLAVALLRRGLCLSHDHRE